MIGFNFFYPTLVQGMCQAVQMCPAKRTGMGYRNTYTILLVTVPPYMLALVMSLCKFTARHDILRSDAGASHVIPR